MALLLGPLGAFSIDTCFCLISFCQWDLRICKKCSGEKHFDFENITYYFIWITQVTLTIVYLRINTIE